MLVPPEASAPQMFLLQLLILVWLVALGAAFGSFINVVIYRLPRGMNLAIPGSHCPVCKHPIRWFDNVPIFSWIVLRGQCRDCGASISPRYLLVEATTGLIFGLVGWIDFLRPLTLAIQAASGSQAPAPWSSTATFSLSLLAGLHLLVVCSLLVAALIETEGQTIPARLFCPLAVVAVLVWLAWPMLRTEIPADLPLAVPSEGLASGIAAVVLGATAWPLAIWITRPAAGSGGDTGKWGLSPGALVLGGASLGLGLGWQAVGIISILGLLLHGAYRLLPERIRKGICIPWAGWNAVLSLVWILGGFRLLR